MTSLTEYMKSRRSALSMTLEEPGPSSAEINTILEIASRVPDHGKLAPWRFVLWTPEARKNMHGKLTDLLKSKPEMEDAAKKQQGTDKLLHAPCVLGVISTAQEHPKIPIWEQHLSTGAVCMNALIAANSLGYEAQWLTAWYVYEHDADEILGLDEGERVAGILHVGSSPVSKNERPRPDIDSLFTIRES